MPMATRERTLRVFVGPEARRLARPGDHLQEQRIFRGRRRLPRLCQLVKTISTRKDPRTTLQAALSAACTRFGSIGSCRRRLPAVSCPTALAIAGAITGTPASPMPLGGLSVEITLTSTEGTSDMRSTRYSSKLDC